MPHKYGTQFDNVNITVQAPPVQVVQMAAPPVQQAKRLWSHQAKTGTRIPGCLNRMRWRFFNHTKIEKIGKSEVGMILVDDVVA